MQYMSHYLNRYKDIVDSYGESCLPSLELSAWSVTKVCLGMTSPVKALITGQVKAYVKDLLMDYIREKIYPYAEDLCKELALCSSTTGKPTTPSGNGKGVCTYQTFADRLFCYCCSTTKLACIICDYNEDCNKSCH